VRTPTCIPDWKGHSDMARPFNKQFTTKVVVASPAGAAETIIATLANVSTDGPSQQVNLAGWAAFTVGTSGTAVRFRIRESSLTGTLVADSGAVTGGVAAGNLLTGEVNGIDLPGDVAGLVYELTMQVTAGAAASTVSAVALTAIVSD
jgi:hypothetical protein